MQTRGLANGRWICRRSAWKYWAGVEQLTIHMLCVRSALRRIHPAPPTSTHQPSMPTPTHVSAPTGSMYTAQRGRSEAPALRLLAAARARCCSCSLPLLLAAARARDGRAKAHGTVPCSPPSTRGLLLCKAPVPSVHTLPCLRACATHSARDGGEDKEDKTGREDKVLVPRHLVSDPPHIRLASVSRMRTRAHTRTHANITQGGERASARARQMEAGGQRGGTRGRGRMGHEDEGAYEARGRTAKSDTG